DDGDALGETLGQPGRLDDVGSTHLDQPHTSAKLSNSVVTVPSARTVRWKTPRSRMLEPSDARRVSWKVAVEVIVDSVAPFWPSQAVNSPVYVSWVGSSGLNAIAPVTVAV